MLNSLDRNAITVDNIINFEPNSDNIFTSGKLFVDPTDENADKNRWNVHWKEVVQWVAFAVAEIATVVVTVVNPAAGAEMAGFCFKAALSGMIMGGIAGGITNAIKGRDFWDGLAYGAIYGFIDAYTTAAIFYGISAATNAISNAVNRAKPLLLLPQNMVPF